jgi:hypothetical protein
MFDGFHPMFADQLRIFLTSPMRFERLLQYDARIRGSKARWVCGSFVGGTNMSKNQGVFP